MSQERAGQAIPRYLPNGAGGGGGACRMAHTKSKMMSKEADNSMMILEEGQAEKDHYVKSIERRVNLQ